MAYNDAPPNPVLQGEARTSMAAALNKAFGAATPSAVLSDDTLVKTPAVPIVTPQGDIPPAGPTGAPATPAPPVIPPAPGTPAAATGATGAPTPPIPELTPAEKLAEKLAGPTETPAPGEPAKAAADKAAADAAAAEVTRKAEGRLTDAEKDAAEKNMTIPAGTAFKKIRAENTALEKAIADERALREAAEAKVAVGKTSDPEVVAELQATIKRYETELAATKIEATDTYKKLVTTPLEKTQAELLALGVKYKVSEGALRAALMESDPAKRRDQLSDLVENVEDFKRLDTLRFEQLATQLDTIDVARAELLATSTESAKNLTDQQKAEAAAAKDEIQRNWNHALIATRDKLTKEIPVFGQTGDEKWDTELKSKLDEVQSMDIASLSNEDLARNMYTAKAVPMLLNLITELFTQNRNSQSMITKLRGTSVPAGDGTPPAREMTTPPAPQSFAEAAKGRLAGILPP